MANWRIHTCDRAILKAIEGGFNDPDFEGWTNLPPDIRLKCVEGILSHNGMENVVYRRTFVRGLWPKHQPPVGKTEDTWEPGVECTSCGQELGMGSFSPQLCYYWHAQHMVVADDWCRYLREHI